MITRSCRFRIDAFDVNDTKKRDSNWIASEHTAAWTVSTTPSTARFAIQDVLLRNTQRDSQDNIAVQNGEQFLHVVRHLFWHVDIL